MARQQKMEQECVNRWLEKEEKEESEKKKSVRVRVEQSDQMARLFIQSLAFYNNKTLPKTVKYCQIGSKFYQTPNKPSRYCPRPLQYCQSSEIFPNLVTLSVLVSDLKPFRSIIVILVDVNRAEIVLPG